MAQQKSLVTNDVFVLKNAPSPITYVLVSTGVGIWHNGTQAIWNLHSYDGQPTKHLHLPTFVGSLWRGAIYGGTVGSVFAIGLTTAQSFRRKDDSINYGIAGASAAAFTSLSSPHILHSAIVRGFTFGVLASFTACHFSYVSARHFADK